MLEPVMGAAGRMLTNTSKQLGPLVEAHPASLKAFLPQTGPASSATEVFHYLRECAYREATLNPPNRRDRAVDWEASVFAISQHACCCRCLRSTEQKG